MNEDLDREISVQEVRRAIRKLKKGKAAGVDGVVAEILKEGGEEIVNALAQLCSKAWKDEKVPTDWTRGIISPIFKDGEKEDPQNYRGITLLSIVGKVYTSIVDTRMMRWCERKKI